MIVRSSGYTITDIPGIREIRVAMDADGYAEIQIDQHDCVLHLDGLEQVITALKKAATLAQQMTP